MATHNIKVRSENGRHVCDPMGKRVKPGDVITWDGSNVESFVLESNAQGPPFTKGGFGPFSTKASHTVNSKPPLKSNDRFTFKGFEGDIIID